MTKILTYVAFRTILGKLREADRVCCPGPTEYNFIWVYFDDNFISSDLALGPVEKRE